MIAICCAYCSPRDQGLCKLKLQLPQAPSTSCEMLWPGSAACAPANCPTALPWLGYDGRSCLPCRHARHRPHLPDSRPSGHRVLDDLRRRQGRERRHHPLEPGCLGARVPPAEAGAGLVPCSPVGLTCPWQRRSRQLQRAGHSCKPLSIECSTTSRVCVDQLCMFKVRMRPCRQAMASRPESAAPSKSPLARLVDGWRLYLQQAVLPAAFALALLYLTVLSLGLLMTAYLKWLVGLPWCTSPAACMRPPGSAQQRVASLSRFTASRGMFLVAAAQAGQS